MSDLEKYIKKRKKRDIEFAEDFDEKYAKFKIGSADKCFIIDIKKEWGEAFIFI